KKWAVRRRISRHSPSRCGLRSSDVAEVVRLRLKSHEFRYEISWFQLMDNIAERPGLVVSQPRRAAAPASAASADVSMNGDGQVQRQPKPLWHQILMPLASLKLTVVLFALSLILMFYGTCPQVYQGICSVVSNSCRIFGVLIPLKVILFHSIDESPFAIPFPGGWLLGGLLFANLLAAHAVRFKMTWRRSGIFILHAGLILMM